MATEPTPAAPSGSGAPNAARAHASLVYIELAPALIYSPGGLGPSYDAWLNLRVQPIERISFSMFALAPLYQAPLRADEGSVAVRTLVLGAGADLHWERPQFDLSGGLAGAALFTWMLNPAPGSAAYVSQQGQMQRTGALLLRAAFAWHLSSDLSLFARGLAGVAIPELKISFAERTAATWGMPLVSAIAGLEWALPYAR